MLISFLRRFVRREKEIAETKVEALETESIISNVTSMKLKQH